MSQQIKVEATNPQGYESRDQKKQNRQNLTSMSEVELLVLVRHSIHRAMTGRRMMKRLRNGDLQADLSLLLSWNWFQESSFTSQPSPLALQTEWAMNYILRKVFTERRTFRQSFDLRRRLWNIIHFMVIKEIFNSLTQLCLLFQVMIGLTKSNIPIYFTEWFESLEYFAKRIFIFDKYHYKFTWNDPFNNWRWAHNDCFYIALKLVNSWNIRSFLL